MNNTIHAILVFFILIMISCVRGAGVDKKYALVADKSMYTGKLEFRAVKQSDENYPEKDMHVMICVFRPDSPVLLQDSDGEEIYASVIQFIGGMAPMPGMQESDRVGVRAKFFKKHRQSHHTQIVAEAGKIEYLPSAGKGG